MKVDAERDQSQETWLLLENVKCRALRSEFSAFNYLQCGLCNSSLVRHLSFAKIMFFLGAIHSLLPFLTKL